MGVEGGRPQQFVQQTERGAARLDHGPLAAGQPKCPEVGRPLESARRDPKELSAPDGVVESVPGPVPGDSRDRAADPVLGHAGEHVGIVVLHAHHGQAAGLCVPRRDVIRVEIAGDCLGLQVVERREVSHHSPEGAERLGGLQVPYVLAEKDIMACRHGYHILEMRADS